MYWPGFCGPSYEARSLNVNAERCINFYPERVESGTPKVKTWLVGTPGLRGYCNFTVDLGGPVRALWAMNGRAFAVIGQGFYEFFAAQYGKRWGSMVNDGRPATICSNGTQGHQILITSGGFGYIFNTQTNTFEQITDPNFPDPCTHAVFIDGYFIALRGQSRQFYLSELLDGTDWSGELANEISWAADDLRAIAANHRELWLFGGQTTHVWYDTGDLNTPFMPVSGVVIDQGILAPYSVVNIDNTLMWLGANRDGQGIVWRAQGYTPMRVSTHSVEYWLGQKGHLDQAIAYAYQDEGHSFYVLYVPNAETTFVYDVATGWWHERATWNEDTGFWEPHEGRCHCFAFGKHFIGSRTTGQIYHQSLEYYDEDVTLRSTTVDVATPSAAAGEVTVPTIGRALWFGYFYSASVRYGYNTDGIPQNVLYVEDAPSVAWALANGYHMVITADADLYAAAAGNEDWVVGILVEGADAAAVATAAGAAVAGRPSTLADRPILGICNGFLPSSAISNVDWLGLECYTLATETADQCEARIGAALTLLSPAQSVCLVGLSFTSNTSYTQDATQLERSQVIPANIAATDSRVRLILMYSDGRPTGTQDHEEWRPLHEDIFAGVTQPVLASRSPSRSTSASSSQSPSASSSLSESLSESSSPSGGG